jgi:argininosuccinate lyase
VAIRDGRFSKKPTKAFSRLNVSIDFDRRLYRQDIKGSVAYAMALRKAGILSDGEMEKIVKGLQQIEKEIDEGTFGFREEDEDIHMNIERGLFEKIGDTAGKLHTGRSRNEQIVLDERLYLMEKRTQLEQNLLRLCRALHRRAKEHVATLAPAYTHMRQAQPVSLAHLFLAYFEALWRDKERLSDFKKRLSVMPLGSGAVAGSSIGIDRELLRKELGFERISCNSIDAVSARDFIFECAFICSSVLVTLSRIAEDLIFFSSDELGIVRIPNELCTTSSLMPQKKNPDSLELIRAKTGRGIGNLVSLLTMMKGLPYTYNRDMQEDKERLFDTVDTTQTAAEVMEEVIAGLIIDEKALERLFERSGGFFYATDLADYLVRKGRPFREAHLKVGKIVRAAVEKTTALSKLPIEEYQKFDPLFFPDVYDLFDPMTSVNAHDVQGGTALNRVKQEILRIEKALGMKKP